MKAPPKTNDKPQKEEVTRQQISTVLVKRWWESKALVIRIGIASVVLICFVGVGICVLTHQSEEDATIPQVQITEDDSDIDPTTIPINSDSENTTTNNVETPEINDSSYRFQFVNQSLFDITHINDFNYWHDNFECGGYEHDVPVDISIHHQLKESEFQLLDLSDFRLSVFENMDNYLGTIDLIDQTYYDLNRLLVEGKQLENHSYIPDLAFYGTCPGSSPHGTLITQDIEYKGTDHAVLIISFGTSQALSTPDDMPIKFDIVSRIGNDFAMGTANGMYENITSDNHLSDCITSEPWWINTVLEDTKDCIKEAFEKDVNLEKIDSVLARFFDEFELATASTESSDQLYTTSKYPNFSLEYENSWNLTEDTEHFSTIGGEHHPTIKEPIEFNTTRITLSKEDTSLIIELRPVLQYDGYSECFPITEEMRLSKIENWFRFFFEDGWTWYPRSHMYGDIIVDHLQEEEGQICVNHLDKYIDAGFPANHPSPLVSKGWITLRYTSTNESSELLSELDQVVESMKYE